MDNANTITSPTVEENLADERDSSGETPNDTSASAIEAATSKDAASEEPLAIEPPGGSSQLEPRDPVEVSIRSLLEAGVHFGHQTARWNPTMKPYIHSVRNGIHIINLPKTLAAWQDARAKIVDTISRGGTLLFVGTKKQAQDAVIEEAQRCGSFYVARRWLGGMVTNFQTIRKSIERMKKVEQTLEDEAQAMKSGMTPKFTKKERLMMSRELEKLNFSLGGIRDMHRPPDIMFVIDIKREDIAVREARRLDIPVVALVDTNCDPSGVNYSIPSNDDGTRAIRLFVSAVSDAVNEGKNIYRDRVQQMKEKDRSEKVPASSKSEKKAKDTGKSAKEKDAAESDQVTA